MLVGRHLHLLPGKRGEKDNMISGSGGGGATAEQFTK